MAKINLLPWREEQRRLQTQQFGVTALFTAIVAAGVVFVGSKFAQGKIEHQEARNSYMEQEINKLKAELRIQI